MTSPYARAALAAECYLLRSAPEGVRNDQLNRTCFSLAQLVSGGELDRDEAAREVYAAAVDCGLEADPECGKVGIIATMKSGFGAGFAHPRSAPERPSRSNGCKVLVPPRDPVGVTCEVCDAREGVLSGPELLALDFPPRIPLLGRWLYPGDRMLLHGPRGSGKSHVAMAVALALAAGPDGPGFLGWNAARAVRVLFLDFELGARRLKAIVEGCMYATMPRTPVLDTLSVYPGHNRLRNGEDLAALDAMIAHVGAEVVVVDSQTFAYSLESENDAAEWAPYADWINSLSGRDVTYIGLGHDGHVQGRARGSSAREDSLDLVLGLERKSHDAAGIDVTLRWTKTRGLAPCEVDRLRVRLGDAVGPGGSYPAWVWEPDEDERTAALDARATAIRDLSAAGLQQIEIAARLGVSRSAVQRALRRGA